MILELALMTFLPRSSLAVEALKAVECRGDLKMIVTGLDSSEGQIKFDLDNNAETFKPRKDGPPAFKKGRSPIQDKRVEYIFKDIPCGEYAVKLYHDANMNQDLDKNFLNMPKEQYGFSSCKGCVLPPKWEKAKFKFDKEHPEITIDL
ncbi:MAG: DUF2141 domain-containing protein [Bacteriovorax sp.]